MKLLFESWRNYLGESQYEISPQFVAGSLGMEMPLNESYPYSSSELNEEILAEYLLFEGFFGDLGDKIKQGATDTWAKAKAMPKEIADIFKMFYKAIKEGHGANLAKSVWRLGLQELRTKLNKFLQSIIDKGDEWNIPTFAKWAQKIKNGIQKVFDYFSGLKPWQKGLGFAGILIALKRLWTFLGDGIDDFIKGPTVEKVKKILSEKVMAAVGKIFSGLINQAKAAMGDITEYWEMLKKIGEEAKFVLDILKPITRRFMSRV